MRTARALTLVSALAAVVLPCTAACTSSPAAERSGARSDFALNLGSGALSMAVGDTVTLHASPVAGDGTPFAGLYTLAWATSKAGVVVVTANGTLTAQAAGTATVTATATRVDTGAVATASVDVTVGGGGDAGGGGGGDAGGGGGGDAGSTQATFTADTAIELQNPERGWWWTAGTAGAAEWCTSFLTRVRDGAVQNQPVTLFYYPFNPATNTPAQVATDLACVRAAGAKVIVSPEYCGSLGCDEGVTLAQAQAQLQTFKSTFLANRDVIFVMRMGVIGGWGEGATWHGGSVPANVRETIRDTLLDVTPPEIQIAMRNPPRVQEYAQNVPLNASTAYSGAVVNGTVPSRIGLFNDCFMAEDGDRHTYAGPGDFGGAIDPPYTHSATEQRAFAAANTAFTHFGGETCIGSGAPPDRLACNGGADNSTPARPSGIMNEGPRYHLSWLDVYYDRRFIDQWQSEGCYADVTNLMGYRLQLDSIAHPLRATPGSNVSFAVSLHNYGWGRVQSARPLALRMKKSGASDVLCSFGAASLRDLPPQSSTPVTLTTRCAISASAPTGTWTVHVEMPDLPMYDATIPGRDARFKIRPANADVGGQAWNAAAGTFSTGTTIDLAP